VGCGRSGTQYIAALLTELGVYCGHEAIYTPRGVKRRFRMRGDSSFLAVPYLAEFGGTVLHQTREPLAVIASFVGRRFFSADPERDVFLRFARRHVELSGDDLRDAMRWYSEWNERCEQYATMRYRVEDIDARLEEIVATIGVDVTGQQQLDALATVRRDINRRAGAVPLTWADLPAGPDRDRLDAVARRYGY
jgi:hypothetical protein